MKVLFASSEAYPFAMSGGLADVAGALPKALRKRLVGCRIVMPLYSCIPDELREKMSFICSITVSVAWRRQYCGIFEAHMDGVIYYFIDNQYYFKRDGLYGHAHTSCSYRLQTPEGLLLPQGSGNSSGCCQRSLP